MKSKTREVAFDEEILIESIITSSYEHLPHLLGIPERKHAKISRPIFIVGSPRSGTTVLGYCLGEHSQIASSKESLFLLQLWRLYVDLYAGGLISKVKHLEEYVSEIELLASLGSFSDSIFSGLLEKKNKTIFLDHTPWYGTIAPFIKKIYPDAVFIHIIRDGRQVV